MKIDVEVPEGQSGDYRIEEFVVSQKEADFENLRLAIGASSARGIEAGKYKRLLRKGTVIMSNTPREIEDHEEAIEVAQGSVLINGLGLGMYLTAILKKEEVKDVTVIEISQDVINLVGPTFNDPRVEIICADAFIWEPPKDKVYDIVWHDIWNDICGDNWESMDELCEKYKGISKWQDCWGQSSMWT